MPNFTVLLFAGQVAGQRAGNDCTEKDIIAAVVAAEQGDNLFTFPDPACRTGAKCFADCPLQCKNDIKTLTAGKAYCNDGKVEITQPLCDVDAATRKKYGNGVSCMGARFPSCNKCDDDWCDASSPDDECKFENGVCTEKTAEDVCKLPAKKGVCRAHFKRYFFDSEKGKCRVFYFGGCGGNKNNFASENECKASCPGSSEKAAAGSITASTTSAPPATTPAPATPGSGGFEEVLEGYEIGCPGCPRKCNCFNGNKSYPSLLAASKACSETSGCKYINHWINGGYFLRRETDPKAKNSRCTNFVKTTPYVKVLVGTEVGCPGCPGKCNCFNGNTKYSSLSAASQACDVTPDCDLIDHWKDGSYYLRRKTDPKGKNNACTNFVKPTTYVEILDGYEVGCPETYNCFNGNKSYPSLLAATYACELTLGCDIINYWKGSGYYLRRKTDPKAKNSRCTNFAKPNPYKEDLVGTEVGCPGGWRCFNRNIRYPTLLAAQTACDVTPGCGIINHWKGGGYYLRKNSDPKGRNSRTTNFRKPTQKTDSDWLKF